MSGIAAVVTGVGQRLQSTELAHDVKRMLECIDYRGPDGMSVWTCDAVGLGHASLVTTPEDRFGRQPLRSPLTGCVITADVRLDNRSELLAELEWPAGGNVCDAELVLRAYERWGLDVPRHLTGDFAFAVWDPRHARLVCARDVYGQRPLFYRTNRAGCWVASEIHQLLQDPSVPLAPNSNRILDDLVPANMLRNPADRADTYYTGINALTAGSMLVVTAESVRTERYWEFVPCAELRYRRPAEYVEHFRSLLTDAVRHRLRSDSAVGALLSGGLDSSSLVCLAQELYGAGEVPNRGFETFSAVYPGLECDEQGLIEDAQAKYGFNANFVTPEM
ncbi:MAG: asparagine synthetase B, partial [Chloroflexi bacterium]|nr:asparagine synthetase B [Chloroflexota bacterium]